MPFGGETAESYYDDGLTASMKGEVARAVQCFERAIQLDGAFLAAYHHLGKCYMRIGETERAVKLLEQVVARKPKQIPPRLDLGYALLGAGRADQARQQFAHIMAAEPANPRALLGLAHVCFHEADWGNAVAHAGAALEHGGSNFGALFILGRAAKLADCAELAEQSLKQAEALMEKSVELNPDQPEGYYLGGEVCFAQERYQAALEHYRAAEDRCGADTIHSAFGENFSRTDILAKQGLCHQRLGRIDRARELGKAIVAADPNHKLGQALKDIK